MLMGSILQFRFPYHRIDNPIAALRRTFLGKHVPIEAFQVNMTTLSPQKLCSHLQGHNPGALSSAVYAGCSIALLVHLTVQQIDQAQAVSAILWSAAGLVFCEADGPISLDVPSATPNDPMYGQQVSLQTIKAPTIWAGGQFGSPQVKPCWDSHCCRSCEVNMHSWPLSEAFSSKLVQFKQTASPSS